MLTCTLFPAPFAHSPTPPPALQEVNTYLEGMCVEPCIQSQLQHFLNSLCAECCKAWARKAHNTDARARYAPHLVIPSCCGQG